MTTLNVLFIAACFAVFGCSIYLTVARCYTSGIFGTIGLCFLCLVTYLFLLTWFEEEAVHRTTQTQLLVIGIALFLVQHVIRVIYRNRTMKGGAIHVVR